MKDRIDATEGMLYYIVKKIRPDLAQRIQETNKLETMIIGLGGQGTKHAGMMNDFGTTVAAGVAPGKGGSRVHEVIPVYDQVKEALEEHPNIVAASIWRHYATARDAAIEVIEAGVPLVVLITEFIPLRDVRDILVAARQNNTVLIGGNTPGLIFPPERIKIGMLPDVFYPEQKTDGQFGPKGVTIISRSGAILYHMSDAMASVGIAQNAVIGTGGDGALGSTFKDLVPLAQGYENTDLIIVAGEIGGCMEEMLAEDIKAHPEKYPKPVVALISGAHAPEGKTMGHAGAIVTPGLETGTFKSKKAALESAGVTVVNSQYDLITAVQETLKGNTYFKPADYYEKMRKIWEAPPAKPSWGTLVTKVQPNNLIVRGYPLQQIVENASLIEAAHLIVHGELPEPDQVKAWHKLAIDAAQLAVPDVYRNPDEDLSKTLQKYFLNDEALATFLPSGKMAQVEKTIFALGRFTAYLANILGTAAMLDDKSITDFSSLISRVISGQENIDATKARMLEAMIVASIDHGVTPPSAQATLIATSVRASYESGVAQGVGAITDVHGGAGEKAASFFRKCVQYAEKEGVPIDDATRAVMGEYVKSGKRIEGMGHRVHTQDPRRDVLWQLSESNNLAGSCVAISKIAGDILKEVRGLNLPINVDGVIGAIIADMGLDPKLAKALFVFGRVCGLSAHYFEEIMTQTQMRRINFAQAVYKGPEERNYPK